MKKLLQLSQVLLLAGLGFGLAACSDDELTDETNFETVQDFMEKFEIPDSTSVLKNVYLPRNIGETGSIIWESDNSNVLDVTGVVNRTMQDEEVNLSALITLGGTTNRFYYTATVKALPATQTGRLEEAIDDFYLTHENSNGELYVNRDIMTLPRVTDLHTIYIDWSSSDESIVDLDGNVYRTDKDQEVTLTATFNYYEFASEYEGSTIVGSSKSDVLATDTKEFKVKVSSTTDDSAELIDVNHSQIKRKVYVENNSELYVAIQEARPGDGIILKDGAYDGFKYDILTSGTEKNGIFIFAENPGKVTFTGITQINVIADYVTIANLVFKDGSPFTDMGVITIEGNYCRITNCTIDGFEKTGNGYKWISLTGTHHEVDKNVLQNKTTSGSLLTVWREDLANQYHYIHDNYFYNFSDTGGANGYETIRVGTSDYSQCDSNVLIENNLFEALNGEIEIISVKSGRVIVKDNTFDTCLGLVTFRHGKNSMGTGNIFYGGGKSDAGGFRMYDGGHQIKNNYIYDTQSSSNSRSAIVIHSGVNLPNANATLNLQWTAYNISVIDNTILNVNYGINLDTQYTYASEDVYIQGNLIITSKYAINTLIDRTDVEFGDNNEFWCSEGAVDFNGDLRTLAESSFKGSYADGQSTYNVVLEAKYQQFSNSIGAQGLVQVLKTSVGTSYTL